MFTSRGKALAVSSIVGALLTVGLSSPAEAGSGQVTASPGVIYSDCQNLRYSFSATPDDGYTDDLVIGLTAYAPDGTAVASEHYYGETSGKDVLAACDLDQEGTYRIEMRLSGASADGDIRTFTASSTFAMRFAATHTRASARRVGDLVRIRLAVTRESRHGDVAYEWAAVVLQERRHGRWHRIPRTVTFTDDAGRATVRVRRHAGVLVRARTIRMPEYAPITPSTSRPLTLP